MPGLQQLDNLNKKLEDLCKKTQKIYTQLDAQRKALDGLENQLRDTYSQNDYVTELEKEIKENKRYTLKEAIAEAKKEIDRLKKCKEDNEKYINEIISNRIGDDKKATAFLEELLTTYKQPEKIYLSTDRFTSDFKPVFFAKEDELKATAIETIKNTHLTDTINDLESVANFYLGIKSNNEKDTSYKSVVDRFTRFCNERTKLYNAKLAYVQELLPEDVSTAIGYTIDNLKTDLPINTRMTLEDYKLAAEAKVNEKRTALEKEKNEHYTKATEKIKSDIAKAKITEVFTNDNYEHTMPLNKFEENLKAAIDAATVAVTDVRTTAIGEKDAALRNEIKTSLGEGLDLSFITFEEAKAEIRNIGMPDDEFNTLLEEKYKEYKNQALRDKYGDICQERGIKLEDFVDRLKNGENLGDIDKELGTAVKNDIVDKFKNKDDNILTDDEIGKIVQEHENDKGKDAPTKLQKALTDANEEKKTRRYNEKDAYLTEREKEADKFSKFKKFTDEHMGKINPWLTDIKIPLDKGNTPVDEAYDELKKLNKTYMSLKEQFDNILNAIKALDPKTHKDFEIKARKLFKDVDDGKLDEFEKDLEALGKDILEEVKDAAAT